MSPTLIHLLYLDGSGERTWHKPAEHKDQVLNILTPEEAYELFDRKVRRLIHMSGEEFMRRWDAGEFAEIADTPGNLYIMRLALMIPRVAVRTYFPESSNSPIRKASSC